MTISRPDSSRGPRFGDRTMTDEAVEVQVWSYVRGRSGAVGVGVR